MATATEAPASTTAEGPTSHTQNQADQPANTFGYTRDEQIEALRKLRDPFPESEIRYLPRVWCKACKDARGTCSRNDHERRQCRRCGQSMTTAHIDLKFVGHAEATNRLLNVDPFWDWVPLTTDAAGLPQYDQNRGLWIRLTVCGMTRLGYGNAEGKSGGDAVKEIIGDAIRNAGMRFGMALDLWTSSDLEIIESGGPATEDSTDVNASSASAAPSSPAPQAAAAPAGAPEQGQDTAAQLERLMKQVADCWNTRLPLLQIWLEGKKLGLAEQRVQGPPPEHAWTTFDELVDGRIQELKAAA